MSSKLSLELDFSFILMYRKGNERFVWKNPLGVKMYENVCKKFQKN